MEHGDCLEVLRGVETGTFDACVTDPPYPEVDREYGRWSESEWMILMQNVVREVRRVLKPKGSAAFILQPNSAHVGTLRPWLWDFMAWASREWNQVQDAWWWNITAPPNVHAQQKYGLMRPSLKAIVWLGAPNCYRNQDAVLWEPSQAIKAVALSDRALQHLPSGYTMRPGRVLARVLERGGSTPFNVLPIANSNSVSSGGAKGHGAATPLPLMRWWTKYLCPIGGIVLDPFAGSGTTGLACAAEGFDFVGIEKEEAYVRIAEHRLASAGCSSAAGRRHEKIGL